MPTHILVVTSTRTCRHRRHCNDCITRAVDPHPRSQEQSHTLDQGRHCVDCIASTALRSRAMQVLSRSFSFECHCICGPTLTTIATPAVLLFAIMLTCWFAILLPCYFAVLLTGAWHAHFDVRSCGASRTAVRVTANGATAARHCTCVSACAMHPAEAAVETAAAGATIQATNARSTARPLRRAVDTTASMPTCSLCLAASSATSATHEDGTRAHCASTTECRPQRSL